MRSETGRSRQTTTDEEGRHVRWVLNEDTVGPGYDGSYMEYKMIRTGILSERTN